MRGCSPQYHTVFLNFESLIPSPLRPRDRGVVVLPATMLLVYPPTWSPVKEPYPPNFLKSTSALSVSE